MECTIIGCSVEQPESSLSTINICKHHYRNFYRYTEYFNGGDIIDVCPNSGCRNLKLRESSHCHQCDKKNLQVSEEILSYLYNRWPSLKSKFSDDVYKLLRIISSHSQMGWEWKKIKNHLDSLMEDTMANTISSLTRRPSKAQLAKEAKQAALQVATQKLVNTAAAKIPALAKSVGLDETKADLLGAFLETSYGKALMTTSLATLATYVPLPGGDKYEALAANVAQELRKQAMVNGGNALWNIVTPLFDGFLKDVREAEKAVGSLEQMAREVADFSMEEETVAVGGGSSKKKAKAASR